MDRSLLALLFATVSLAFACERADPAPPPVRPIVVARPPSVADVVDGCLAGDAAGLDAARARLGAEPLASITHQRLLAALCAGEVLSGEWEPAAARVIAYGRAVGERDAASALYGSVCGNLRQVVEAGMWSFVFEEQAAAMESVASFFDETLPELAWCLDDPHLAQAEALAAASIEAAEEASAYWAEVARELQLGPCPTDGR